MQEDGIGDINIDKDDAGKIEKVRIGFGPHYFVELHSKDQGGVEFVLGATHHGFHADASEVGGDLEKIINEVRVKHADKLVD